MLSSRSSLLAAAGFNMGGVPLSSRDGGQGGDIKKVSSTLNTLRGLESGRVMKAFENLGQKDAAKKDATQPQVSNHNLLNAQQVPSTNY